jgi:hypothetical protein
LDSGYDSLSSFIYLLQAYWQKEREEEAFRSFFMD